MLKISKKNGIKNLLVNDKGQLVNIRQPNIIELNNLYNIILANLAKSRNF